MGTFKNTANLEEIEVRTSMSVKAFLVVISTGFVVLMIYKLPNELFNWQKFNPNGIFTLAFIAVFILFILSWMSLLDNQPKFKIDKSAFWVRKTILPFSSLTLINWEDIKHVEYSSVRQKNRTSFFFIIYRKDSSKTKRIELDNIDQRIKEVLNVIRKFSSIMNYVDRINVTQ
ncbi:hypothetical protein AR687_14955 [Flavobacteriaceae bacterium CRH]|nr:hypothetical protein AR687_14955 [Flavobacteriaceae bacterium CRH]